MPVRANPPRPMTKSNVQAGDDLNLAISREVILLAGSPGSGKSYSVAKLCEQGLDEFEVVVLDRDRGLAKAIQGIFGKKAPTNLTYFLANEWDKMEKAVDYALTNLEPGDWFVSEMVGSMWDFAQTEYSRRVYGEDVTDHLLALRADAQEVIDAAKVSLRSSDPKAKKEAQRILGEKMQYSGMEGRTDWSVIKRLHSDKVFDHLIRDGQFNMLSTTSLTALSTEEINRGSWPLFQQYGKRPEGEKHNIHRYDTLVMVERKQDEFTWRTDLGGGKGKDRNRTLYRDVDFTDTGFVASYLETHRAEDA